MAGRWRVGGWIDRRVDGGSVDGSIGGSMAGRWVHRSAGRWRASEWIDQLVDGGIVVN